MIRADIDPDHKARELVATAVGSGYSYLIDPSSTDPAAILREAVVSLAAAQIVDGRGAF